MNRILVALALTLTVAAPALADPASDVKNAMLAFAGAKSFHVSADAGGRNVEADIVPPARAHFVAGQFEMITISGTTWVKAGGSWHQFTIPGMDQITVFVNGAIDSVRNPPTDMVVRSRHQVDRRRDAPRLHDHEQGRHEPEHDLPRRLRDAGAGGE